MLRSRFLWKLYTGYVALILLSTFIVGVLAARQVRRNALEEIEASLRARALLLTELATGALEGDFNLPLQEHVTALGESIGTRLTLIRADGVVIADSEADPEFMGDHSNRPEVLAARHRGSGTATRPSKTVNVDMMYLALAIHRDGRLIGYVRTSLPLSAVSSRIGRLQTIVVLAATATLLVALALGFFFAQRFTRPLDAMTAVAESMAAGDYDHVLPVTSRDEIGKLAHALNRLAESSRQRIERIVTDHNKLLTILAGMVEGVVAIDRDEHVAHMNAAAGRILRATPQTGLGQPIREVTRLREVYEALHKALHDRAEVRGQLRLVERPRDRIVGIHASPLLDGDGELVGAVVVLHDVSELHRLETVRRDFVANVSHELKTPITAIRGLVETVIDDGEMSPENRARFLDRIRDQSMRLSAIVTDLLTLSRLESEATMLELSSMDLRQPVLAALQPLLSIAAERGLSMETEIPAEPVEIMGDDEALRQAASNLLDNALKYTAAGGHVWVRVRAEDGNATVEVQDTGVGIEPRDQMRIFERFYRVDKARSRELGGTGLGLSIVKHVVLAHEGDVSVESCPGTGSTFRIRIPRTSTVRRHAGA